MRIGLTNYYSTKNIILGAHAQKTNGYVLVVYGKTRHQINTIMQGLQAHHIYAQHRNFYRDIPLPVLEIRNTQSVENLEKCFEAQGIPLDPQRFEKTTDWDDVLEEQMQLHQTLLQKFSDRLSR